MGYVIRSACHPQHAILVFCNSRGETDHYIASLGNNIRELEVWEDQEPLPPITTGNIEVVGPYSPVFKGKRVLYPVTNHAT